MKFYFRKYAFWWILIVAIQVPCLSGFALCVKINQANLRSGPGPKFKKTWVVGKYTPLLQIGSRHGWRKVKDQDGEIHWVYHTAVSSKMRCMSVKVNAANIRSGPGSKYSKDDWGPIDKYSPLLRIDDYEDWYKVLDIFGQEYWIYHSNIWRPLKIAKFSF